MSFQFFGAESVAVDHSLERAPVQRGESPATVPRAKFDAAPANEPKPMMLLTPVFQPPGAARFSVTRPFAEFIVSAPVTLIGVAPAITRALTVAAPAKFKLPMLSPPVAPLP